MKKKDLFTVLGAINNLGNVKGVKFAYGLAKNKKILNDEIEIIKDAFGKLTPEEDKTNQEYESKRITLATKFSKKDADGTPVIENNNYKLDDPLKFTKALEKLKSEYDEILTKRLELSNANEELLDEDIELEFYKIKVENLPNELSLNELDPISEFIAD